MIARKKQNLKNLVLEFWSFENVEYKIQGTSLAVQWLGPLAFTAKGVGSIPGRGTKIPQVPRRGQKTNEQTKNETKFRRENTGMLVSDL